MTDVAVSDTVEQRFRAAGLVDVNAIDGSIQIDLVNADPSKNPFHVNFYGGLKTAYLQREVAERLSRAQKSLQRRHPGYSLLILDAARPRSVSRQMYEKVRGTDLERFVANPARGSMHNYGVAVDITIVDALGDELDMGLNPFRKGALGLYWQFLKKKMGVALTDAQKANRKLLADTMAGAGFIPLRFEWWHFNGMPKSEVKKRFAIVE